MCWPSAAQEKLLRACFLPPPQARREFEAWRGEIELDCLDELTLRLLPLLIRAWGVDPLDGDVAGLAQRIHLAQWHQNRQRVALAASLQATLSSAGIPCIFLKGMALLIRYCGDTGLRAMGDVDFLVGKEDVPRAADALLQAGWTGEDRLTANEIASQSRVRHAWQFERGPDESCDLHWHPLVRCYAPQVADAFWTGAEPVRTGEFVALVPCATDQLLHACSHGLQWSWTPQTRWVSDSMTILSSGAALDWSRLRDLARAANMSIRIHAALQYLRDRMQAPVPDRVIEELSPPGSAAWEQREYTLLQKECPLGALDSLDWHVTNFRRIRRYDARWSKMPAGIAFLEYLRTFLRTGEEGGLVASVWHALRKRPAAVPDPRRSLGPPKKF